MARSAGVKVKFRASLEDDCAAMEAIKPDLAIGTTPVVQKGKELGIPSLYFTNLISARPLMGPDGGGLSLQQVVNAAMGNKDRMDAHEGVLRRRRRRRHRRHLGRRPEPAPDFRAQHQKKLDKAGVRPSREGDDVMLIQDHDRAGRLLGLGLCLHRREGPAGHHRRPGGLREPAGDLRPALHRRPAAA
jgi:hypothetical protein